jgi:hypothetical protein
MASSDDRGSHECDPHGAGLDALLYGFGSNLSLENARETVITALCEVFGLARRREISYTVAV